MPLLLFLVLDLVLDLVVTKSRRPCEVMDVALNDFDDTKRGQWNNIRASLLKFAGFVTKKQFHRGSTF